MDETVKIRAKDLRNNKQRKRQACYVCGKHKSITQCHHMIPLSDCADYFNNNDVNNIISPTIWLCPNCHNYVHKMAAGDFKPVAQDIFDVGIDNYAKLLSVAGQMAVNKGCMPMFAFKEEKIDCQY